MGKRAEKNSPRNTVLENKENFWRFKMLGEAGKQREIPEVLPVLRNQVLLKGKIVK